MRVDKCKMTFSIFVMSNTVAQGQNRNEKKMVAVKMHEYIRLLCVFVALKAATEDEDSADRDRKLTKL